MGEVLSSTVLCMTQFSLVTNSIFLYQLFVYDGKIPFLDYYYPGTNSIIEY